jgi:hypothetical protein
VQGPAVRAVGCVACDQRLPLRSLAARLRGSEVVVESGTNSKRQPTLHCQQWLRNVKGAGSATGDMLYNIEPATTVEQRPWRGQRFIAGVHALLTHSSPCSRSVNKGSGRDKDTLKVAVAVESAVY